MNEPIDMTLHDLEEQMLEDVAFCRVIVDRFPDDDSVRAFCATMVGAEELLPDGSLVRVVA